MLWPYCHMKSSWIRHRSFRDDSLPDSLLSDLLRGYTSKRRLDCRPPCEKFWVRSTVFQLSCCLPSSLEKLPVERSCRRIECTRIDEYVTTCQVMLSMLCPLVAHTSAPTFACGNHGKLREANVVAYSKADARELYCQLSRLFNPS